MLWTKGGESKRHVFWVAGRFSEGFPEFSFKTKFVFCFRFFNIFPSKKRRRSVALKATLKKNLVTARMATKCLALVELKLANAPGL